MKKIHISTTLAVILNCIALISIGFNYFLVTAILSTIAYFAAIKEVSKYTSWYQFSTVFASALVVGVTLDLNFLHLPFITIAISLAALGSIGRIVFFKVFSYTNYSWFEPTLFVFALLFFVLGNVVGNYGWAGYAFAAPIIVFNAILAWGILKDKKQLLASTQGGYKVKIGSQAVDFDLPDQDNNSVKLSDFKNHRHLLLIFVRGDWCPGCHMMLRTYEKNNEKFKQKNILVMAIGPDPVGVNRQMVEKLGLDFKVLSDEKQKTAMIYGVQLKEYDNDFAEKYEEGIPLPASFLIDKMGLVRYVSRPDKVGEFLNPSLIFPIIEQLDANYKIPKDIDLKVEPTIKTASTNEENKENETKIAALNKELSNYQSIINQANDAILVIDIVDGKIHQSNPSAAKLLEYSKDELEKISLFDLHPKEYLEKSSSIVADVWEKGGLIYKDIPFITKTNKLIPVECSAKVAPFAGRPAIVIYARDITERLRLENEIISKNEIISLKNKDIEDSINYARRIQLSILPTQEEMNQLLNQHFVFYQPQAVVSGDFYWLTKTISNRSKKPITIVSVADCTGHGVPGALMSLIGNTLLNQTITNATIDSPATALNFLSAELPKNLKQQKEGQIMRDGMDMVICSIDFEENKLQFAGANNPIYIVRNKELIELKGNKQPISAAIDINAKPFTNTSFNLQKNDCIYLFTDGYADQFGGPKEKKFLYKQFKEVLIELNGKEMSEQKNELTSIFENWKGNLPQVDDVLVIGIKI